MPMRFTVLASGSGGNASLLQIDRFGLLLDMGLGPRQLAQRFTLVGVSWDDIQAVVLTHTHSDHWRMATMAHLWRRRIPLYCHTDHYDVLSAYGPAFASMRADGLVRGYRAGEELLLRANLRCLPLLLRHDAGPTFGFRFDLGDQQDRISSIGYVADLGSWDIHLAEALAEVEVLALEFNHDADLERQSGRGPHLIERVLGDAGHLSNEQAFGLLQEVLRLSRNGSLRHVVQLHLSRDCNHPDLARAAACRALSARRHIHVHATHQFCPGPQIDLGMSGCETDRFQAYPPLMRSNERNRGAVARQLLLPGMEE